MKNKLYVSLLIIAFALSASAQTGLTVTITLPKKAFLPGEPIAAFVTIANTTNSNAVLFEKTPTDAVGVRSQLKKQDGEAFRCSYGREGGIVVPKDPDAKSPQSIMAPGERIQIASILDLARCPLTMFKPGFYTVQVEVRSAPARFSEPWGLLASKTETIEIVAPAGEDAAYLDALKKTLAKIPNGAKFGSLKEKPFEWEEVLHSRRINSEQIALTQFPASTYGGYALLGSNGLPWNLLPVEELKMRGKDLATAEKWPETRAQMEQEEKKRKDLNQDRAGKLQVFLQAHPDFAYADFMRLELATRLAYLERYAEAQSLCQELIKKAPNSDEGKKAQQLLDYLKQQGWIKG